MTLIDKAEALAPCPFCGGEAVDLRMGGLVGCEPCGLARRDAASWNCRAALPERGVGDYTLAPHLQKIVEGAKAATQWDMQADRLAPTEPPEEIGILRARIEDQATEIARLTRIIQMQPPAPATTDAAQARDAALREAAAEIKRWWDAARDYREPDELILALLTKETRT